MTANKTFSLYSEVEKEDLDWLWFPYIPYGKITVLQGDPGDGKSTCMINIAASLSKGGTLINGVGFDTAQNIIYQCAEDSVSDTIKPRFEKAGADCSKIAFIDNEHMPLSLLDPRIEEAVKQLHVRLLVFDPIQAFFVDKENMQSANKMREILSQLGMLAEKYNCAVVLIGHMNKSEKGKQLYRGLGSIDIAAIARSVLMITRDKRNSSVRYISQIKNNLGPEGCQIAFILNEVFGFQWIGKCIADNESDVDLLSQEKTTKLSQAKELLKIMLSYEPMPSKEVIKKLSSLNIKERTVRNAVKELDIKAYRKKNVWYWRIEKDETKEDEQH